VAVRTAYDPTAGEILTATNLEKLAGGWIGYVEVTADGSGFTVSTDLAGLSVAVTVGPSRRIRITAAVRISNGTASTYANLFIQESTTVLALGVSDTAAAGVGYTFIAHAVLTPSTGAHTYKLVGQPNAGTATVRASATNPAFILVEDLGPA